MVRLERGGVVVTIQDGYIAVGMPRKVPQRGERILALELQPEDARWLAAVALPAALAAIREAA
jgi:hypothetical protein